jgi:hypothetical protein
MEPESSLQHSQVLFCLQRKYLALWVLLNICFWRGGVVSTSPNPQAGGPPLIVCPRLLIQYIRSYPPYRRPFLHPQPEDAPCRGDRDPLNKWIFSPIEENMETHENIAARLESIRWEPNCWIRTDRHTDVTKLIVAFHNFASAPINSLTETCNGRE